ncbi:MAG TPA: transposase [Patescibacteria group bacterium]|nr:transposase [Patescibacteria group bacterium]
MENVQSYKQKNKKSRKQIRLNDYDYSEPGDYFVTICTQDRGCLFGKIVDGEMVLNDLGEIVENEISNIPKRFKNSEIDIHSVMPNHLHLIISILCDDDIVGATLAVAYNNRAGASPAPTIGDIVGSFKSLCFKEYKKYVEKNDLNLQTKFWQRNYYEEIIKNERHYNEVYNYILSNPSKWEEDRNNPNNIV